MGEFQAIDKYLVVIVLFSCSCREVIITHQEGQIKALNQHSVNKDTTLFDSNAPTSAGKVVGSSSTANRHIKAVSGDSSGDHASAYRPTVPGNSPGAGHPKFEGETKDIKAKVAVLSPPDVECSLAEGCKTDFRPTYPGHSPGIGHSAHQNENNNGEVGRVGN